jgi:hypothetical protein
MMRKNDTIGCKRQRMCHKTATNSHRSAPVFRLHFRLPSDRRSRSPYTQSLQGIIRVLQGKSKRTKFQLSLSNFPSPQSTSCKCRQPIRASDSLDCQPQLSEFSTLRKRSERIASSVECAVLQVISNCWPPNYVKGRSSETKKLCQPLTKPPTMLVHLSSQTFLFFFQTRCFDSRKLLYIKSLSNNQSTSSKVRF